MKMQPKECPGFERRCKEAGLRLTNHRLALYRLLSGREDHPDVETLYREILRDFPRTSRDTVYRALAEFEQLGIVTRMPLSGRAGRFDPRAKSHHHRICVRCGEVSDLEIEECECRARPGACREGEKILGVGVTILVECPRCATSRQDEGDEPK